MSYIPDCRTDENYNEKRLNQRDRDFISGFDWCTEYPVTNAFDNLDNWENDDLDVRPSDIEKVVESFKTFLLEWIEMHRNELITSMIDDMAADEYQKNEAGIAEEHDDVKHSEIGASSYG